MEKQDAIAALASLAQDTRLDVFRLLVRAGLEGLPAGEVGAALDLPSATLSFHLKELKSARMVACERRGRSRIYRPDFETIDALMRFLTENCCQGVASGSSGGAPAASRRRETS
ncbi:MAG: ArsR/SmtB family transcription factor [Myxococcota bacterium]